MRSSIRLTRRSTASQRTAGPALVGIETVNLYSAFVALAVAQAAPGGQIVAIIPRSFCNGPYYRPFRDFILEPAAIRHMHLFDSRSKAFKDDEVLQENIIIRLERGGQTRAGDDHALRPMTASPTSPRTNIRSIGSCSRMTRAVHSCAHHDREKHHRVIARRALHAG
jgi:hypothetical protein